MGTSFAASSSRRPRGQEGSVQGAQDPAPRDAGRPAAQAPPPVDQEGPPDQGQDERRRVPEAAGPPPEGDAREEAGEDLPASLAALVARLGGAVSRVLRVDGLHCRPPSDWCPWVVQLVVRYTG